MICNIDDPRLTRICKAAWERLPEAVRAALEQAKLKIADTPEWKDNMKGTLAAAGIKWNPAHFEQNGFFIEICKSECDSVSDSVVTGAFAHEMGHAYQEHITPGNCVKVENAGDTLPVEWSFSEEIEALIQERDLRNGSP